MRIQMETGLEESMSDAVEGGASLAWRLLATLEGGSLVIGATALLAYTARSRAARKQERRPCNSVLVTNTTNTLGKELKQRFEALGCTVTTLKSSATSGAISEAASETDDKFDALVVVGAERNASGLEAISGLVSEDVYDNLKLLDSLSSRVNCGGAITWACAGASSGAFADAADAFDAALKASLQHAAKRRGCEAVWVGRHATAEEAAERTVAALVTVNEPQRPQGFSIRNAAYKVTGYVGRWLKIVS